MNIVNTGRKIFQLLQQYSVLTGAPTGNVKPNLPSDPDYIAPITDLVACPIPNINIDNITRIRAVVINSTTQFVSCSNVNITIQGMIVPIFSQSFTKGPSQQSTSNYQLQNNSIGDISITTTTSSLGLSSIFKVIWRRQGQDYLIYTSPSFVFNGSTLSINNLQFPFNVLNEDNEIVIVFENDVQTTTTTTQDITTTTTEGTTTTTTSNPNSNVLVFVDSQVDPSTKIKIISFLDAQNNEITFIPGDIDNTNGVQSFSIPTGVYRINIEISGSGGQSLIIQQLSQTVSQSYIGSGIYSFENIDIDGGISVIVNNSLSSTTTVYAKISQSATVVESLPLLPFGLIQRDKADHKVMFYQDQACSIASTFQGTRINFTIKVINNLNSTQIFTFNYENCPIGQVEVLIADLLREQQWDYTLNDPNSAEVNDIISDLSYEYSLLPTFGLIEP